MRLTAGPGMPVAMVAALMLPGQTAITQPPLPQPATAVIDVKRLPPDLVVEVSPTAPSETPAQVTVRNRGAGNAARSSLLRVRITVLPLNPDNLAEMARLNVALGPQFSGAAHEFAGLVSSCRPPFDDFEVAIDALRAGTTQVVRVPARAADPGPRRRPPSGSRVITLGYRIACLYEVRVTADANGDLQEASESNNEVVHRFERMKRRDMFAYVGCADPAMECR